MVGECIVGEGLIGPGPRSKVYVIYATDKTDDCSPEVVDTIFRKEEKAMKYCEIKKQIDQQYEYRVKAVELEDPYFDMNTETAKYYIYSLPTDLDIEEADKHNDDYQEVCIDRGEKFITEEIYTRDGSPCTIIHSYSKNTYKEARKQAIWRSRELLNIEDTSVIP